MNINPVNNININQQNQNARKNPNFTSVIPIKVFIDGEKCTDIPLIHKAIRALVKIVTKPADNNANTIRQNFLSIDPDTRPFNGVVRPIRNRIYGDISYLFTGQHATSLDELGKLIGRAKSNGIASKSIHTNYFNKIKEFINPNLTKRIKYQDKEIGLHILTRSKGNPNKKGFKLIIDKIQVRRIEAKA